MDDKLLISYLNGELDPEDAETFRRSLEGDPAGQEYLDQMERIWQSSAAMKDFQGIDPAGDWQALREEIGFKLPAAKPSPLRQTRSLTRRVLRVAALILLALTTGFMIYYYTGQGALSKPDWISLAVSDHTAEVTLPDGSHVTLNAGCRLAYPDRFSGRKRMVKLNGEAFFEVARNEDKPFLVQVSDMATVQVLGTSFNLRSDSGQHRVLLNVLTGKVAIFPKGKRKQAVEVGQDERAEYHNGKITQDVALDLNFLSWKTRNLVFENTPLPRVLVQLGRHYHRQFIIPDPGVDTLALTGTYQDQEMAEVLEEIALVLDIVFTETEGVIQVTTTDAMSDAE
jgi:ferric-dicitrate binding protein FerR (iron transport regulator)